LISETDGSKLDIDFTKPGVLGFGNVGKYKTLCFWLSFNSDPEQTDIEVLPRDKRFANGKLKVEAHYHTSNGDYKYLNSYNISSTLPLSVGVTDSFRPKL
jgi:hypothetical protein